MMEKKHTPKISTLFKLSLSEARVWSAGSPSLQLHHSSIIEGRVTNERRSAPLFIRHCLPRHPFFPEFLFLSAPLPLSGMQQNVAREEDMSMLSACNRRQLWGRPWLSAAAPVANYPHSSPGGPPLATFHNKPPSYGRPFCMLEPTPVLAFFVTLLMLDITNVEELISNGSQKMLPFSPHGQRAHLCFLFPNKMNMCCIKVFFSFLIR